MTRRALGAVVLVAVLMATVAGCAGGKRSAAESLSSIHQRQAQKAAREALRRARQNAGPGPEPGPPLVAGAAHPQAAKIALRYLGVPYVWGGASPKGFDCSGLVMYVYARLGISLPHYSVSQWNITAPIAVSKLKAGDLVFFHGLGDVGIYIGHGEYVDAPHTGAVVRVESLAARRASFDGARRVL